MRLVPYLLPVNRVMVREPVQEMSILPEDLLNKVYNRF